MCKVTNAIIPPRKAVSAAKTGRKRVHFGKVSAKLFHQPLSRSEKKTIWYSGSEYKAMNKQVQYNLRKELCYGFDPNDSERSWRGLEHIREGIPNVKLNRRRNFVRSFLHVHKTMGVKDPIELGNLASSNSNVDRVRAFYFAEYDAYEASRVYYEHEYPQHYYYDYSTDSSCSNGSGYWSSPCSSFEEANEQAEYYKEFSNVPRATCPKQSRHTVVSTRSPSPSSHVRVSSQAA